MFDRVQNSLRLCSILQVLTHHSLNLTISIYLSLSMLGGICCLLLPIETKGKGLEQISEDLRRLTNSQSNDNNSNRKHPDEPDQQCTKNEVFPLRISSLNMTKSAASWSHLLKKSLMENLIFVQCTLYNLDNSLKIGFYFYKACIRMLFFVIPMLYVI